MEKIQTLQESRENLEILCRMVVCNNAKSKWQQILSTETMRSNKWFTYVTLFDFRKSCIETGIFIHTLIEKYDI